MNVNNITSSRPYHICRPWLVWMVLMGFLAVSQHSVLRLAQHQLWDTDPCPDGNLHFLPSEFAPERVEVASSRFAYAFLIGGCDPAFPTKCTYFVYSIFVAIYMLRFELESVADFVVFCELMPQADPPRLPDDQMRVLEHLGARIIHLASSPRPSFYRTQLLKFNILGLDYERVLYLDSDVLPLANLDYLFDLSTMGILEPNVIVRGKSEPANGGIFLLAPHPGDLAAVHDLIERKEQAVAFDPIIGWGLAMTDPWMTVLTNNGHQWTFHGADGDQGLLYHWVRYRQASVSVVTVRGQIETWRANQLESTIVLSDQDNVTMPPAYHCFKECQSRPRCDFWHFTGKTKPWLVGWPDDLVTPRSRFRSPLHLWFTMLSQVNKRFQMGLNVSSVFAQPIKHRDMAHPNYSDSIQQLPDVWTELMTSRRLDE